LLLSARRTEFTSAAESTKSRGDRRLAAARRLEVDDDSRTHRFRNFGSLVLDRIGARDRELVDTAIDAPLVAERLLDDRRIRSIEGGGELPDAPASSGVLLSCRARRCSL
jgi:hypothetical protein